MDDKLASTPFNPYDFEKAEKVEHNDEEAEALIQSLPTWKRIIFMIIFNFFTIQTFLFVYLGFLVVTLIALPVIFLTLLSIITQFVNMLQDPKTSWYHFVSELLILITYYPIFTLLITISMQMLSSFVTPFKEDAVAVLFNYKTLTKRFYNQNAKRWWMIVQLVFFLIFFIVIDLLLVLRFLVNNINYVNFCKQYLLAFFCINAFITLFGFIRVIFYSWYKYIYPNNKAETNMSKMKITIFDDDKPYMILIPLDYFDPGQLRKQTDWINLLDDPNCNALLTSFKKDIVGKVSSIVTGLLNIFQIICSIAISYETIKTSGSNQAICILLPILSIISFPFISIVNLSIPFYNRKKFEDKNSLGTYLLIVALILIIGIPLLIIIFTLLVAVLQIEAEPVTINYEYDLYGNYALFTSYNNYPSYCLAPITDFNSQPLYYEDMVVLQTLSEYVDTQSLQSYKTWNCTYGENRASFAAILQYIFGTTFPYVQSSHTCFDKQLHSSILEIRDSTNQSYKTSFLLTQGLSSKISVAAFIEIFLQQFFPTIIGALVPFASFAMYIFPEAFNSIQVYSQNGMHISPIVNQVATNTYETILNYISYNPQRDRDHFFGLGQGTGSYVTKLLGYGLKSPGLVIDSLNLFATYTQVFPQEDASRYNEFKFNPNLQQIKFEKTFIGSVDENIYQNIIVPNYYNSTKIMNSFDSACNIIALCDAPSRQKYLKFCEQYFVNKHKQNKYEGCYEFAKVLNYARIKSGNQEIPDEILRNEVCIPKIL